MSHLIGFCGKHTICNIAKQEYLFLSMHYYLIIDNKCAGQYSTALPMIIYNNLHNLDASKNCIYRLNNSLSGLYPSSNYYVTIEVLDLALWEVKSYLSDKSKLLKLDWPTIQPKAKYAKNHTPYTADILNKYPVAFGPHKHELIYNGIPIDT